MPYIPKDHEKYNLLPMCREYGGEVFAYPFDLIDKISKYVNDANSLIPYGFNSYQEYYNKLDQVLLKYSENTEISIILKQYKQTVAKMNIKENWSILRYIGESSGDMFGLMHGHAYYWPCSMDNPVYEGVIDNEEFTSYLYPTDSDFWEILEDPTRMAYRTIYESCERGQHNI